MGTADLHFITVVNKAHGGPLSTVTRQAAHSQEKFPISVGSLSKLLTDARAQLPSAGLCRRRRKQVLFCTGEGWDPRDSGARSQNPGRSFKVLKHYQQ